MKNSITRADQDIARLDVKLAEQLGETVDPRVRAIAEMERPPLDSVKLEATRRKKVFRTLRKYLPRSTR